MLRRFAVITVLSVVLVASVAAIASAAVTFHQGPTCRDIGTQLQCTGNVSGLGNENLSVTVTAQGTGTVQCTNPAGNVAPGQTFTTDVSGSQTGIAPKNGRATFNVTTTAPTAPAGS